MGIRGLTGFIDRNQHLLHSHELHNCLVVIDGNNLYHFLYYGRHVRCYFGGDYDTYRKRVIATFQSFKACGITPYVVLDGAYTVDGRKLKTSLSRASARIRLVDCMSNTERGQALPALTYDTFMQVLAELEIPHVTCQFEADGEIAVLANRLNCPVISNDSDFYIFDLPGGFLPLDYVDFNVLTKSNEIDSEQYNFLAVRKYCIDDFINSFDGLNRTVLPVFASMLGNDFISAGAFHSFYRHFKVPKIVSKNFHLPPNLHKIISVLHWLHSSSENVSEVEEKLLEFVKSERREKVRTMFRTSVSGYCDVENFEGFDLQKFFMGKTEGEEQINACEEFLQHSGRPFPQWFLEVAGRGDLSPFILNTAVLHRVIFLCQMEDLKQATSYACSLSIRRALYGILLKDSHYTNDSETLNSPGSPSSCSNRTPVCDVDLKRVKEKGKEEVKHIAVLNNDVEVVSDRTCPDSDVSNSALICSKSNEETAHNEESDDLTDDENHESSDDDDDERNSSTGSEDNNGPENSELQTPSRQWCVLEYGRLNKGLQKCLIEPLFEVKGHSLPGLTQLATLPLERRKTLLWAALQMDDILVDQFSDDIKLFVACLVTWSHHAQPRLSQLHLNTVLVSLLILRANFELEKRSFQKKVEENDPPNIIKADSKGCKTDEPEIIEAYSSSSARKGSVDIAKVCAECKTDYLEELRQKSSKYHRQAPVFNHKTAYEPHVTHVFAQLQACVVDAINLNKILRLPVPCPRPAQLINGTLLYNLFTELMVRPKPDLFLASLIGRDSPLYQLYLTFHSLVISCVGEAHFADNSLLQTDRKTRKRKAKEKKKSEEGNAEGEAAEREEIPESVSTVPGFDVANKFSLLSVME